MAFDPRKRFRARNEAIRVACATYTTYDDLDIATVPTVDVGPLFAIGETSSEAVDRCVEGIRSAATETGFFYAINHRIPTTAVKQFQDATQQLFNLSAEDKAPLAGVPNGYFAVASENFSQTLGRDGTPDMRQGWRCGPKASPDFPEGRREPSDAVIPGFSEAAEAHFNALTRLDRALREGFSLALAKEAQVPLPRTWMSDVVGRHQGIMTAHDYPAMESAPPGTNRIAAHADLSMFTILRTDGGPGLEVLQGGSWRRLPPAPPDAVVVNVGDLLQMWSNDRFKSSVHRVATPVDGCPQRRSWGWFAAQALAVERASEPEIVQGPIVTGGEQPKYPAYSVRQYIGAAFEALARLQREKQLEDEAQQQAAAGCRESSSRDAGKRSQLSPIVPDGQAPVQRWARL